MKRLFRLIITIIPILFPACFSMPTQVVEEESFLEKRGGAELSYNAEGGEDVRFLLFFSVEREDLDCMILIDLEKSPFYKTIEYQAVQDDRGTGHIVILYDHEEGKNIYYSPGLQIDKDDYDQFQDVRQLRETPIKGFYEYGEGGLKAELSMVDSQGKQVFYSISENHSPLALGGLVAPVADDVEEPDCFPFIYMDYFGFSPVEGTEAEVIIDGVKEEIVSLPVKINGIKPYMIRYSLKSPVLNWNREIQMGWDVVTLKGHEEKISFQGWDYHLVWKGGMAELSSLTSMGEAGEINLRFSPALPNCLYLDPSHEIKGRFSFGSERHRGIFAGEYRLFYEQGWHFILQPTHCSKPPILPGKWWRDYSYELHLSEEEETMTSYWRKK